MREAIIHELEVRSDLADWTLSHVRSDEHQLYLQPAGVESRRQVRREYFSIEILQSVHNEDGEVGTGRGIATLLPGESVKAAVDQAISSAQLVYNPTFELPEPGEIPKVPLTDERLRDDAEAGLEMACQDLKAALAERPKVRLAAAELYAESRQRALVNSRGLSAAEAGTRVYLEAVLLAGEADERVESFAFLTRRRLEDLDVAAYALRQAQYASDLVSAGSAQDFTGNVILSGEILGEFFNCLVFRRHASAEAKYKGETGWQVGKPIVNDEVKGDPLTLWATRVLPYGTRSSRFDDEGTPARRLLVIQDHELKAFSANVQYGSYLSVPISGDFGNVEIAPGSVPETELRSGRHIEVTAFSWFNPDPLTGDFTSEIRMGYLVNGQSRRAFRGGLVVGNVIGSLEDVHFSRETGFFGDYAGPVCARFAGMRLAAGS